MYICLCNGITEGQIRDAIRDGADSMLKLRLELGVASCCGRCTTCAQQVIEETLTDTGGCGQRQAA
jgi:bacterioferritin-associated ferredoxin